MSEITLIFPHQLFKNHPALSHDRPIWIVEEYLFFRQFRFHAHKLDLHRASMQAYADELTKHHYTVRYIESHELTSRVALVRHLKQAGVSHIHVAEVVDNWLEQDLVRSEIPTTVYDSPLFITTRQELAEYSEHHPKPFMKQFYEWQRHRTGILMTHGKPEGGKYSFDTENRKRIPKTYKEPPYRVKAAPQWVRGAIQYVATHFPHAYGNPETFSWAVTHHDARAALDDFITHRLDAFGPYEDALSKTFHHLNHSVLSPYLNIGLITPTECVNAIEAAYRKRQVPLNSAEGCIRQILGWREFIRYVYVFSGTRMRRSNFWHHKNTLDSSWWQAQTSILPVDTIIRRVLDTGYCHHIERLMVLGNYQLLTGTHPDEVYRWFMELFIDAYDWVMVPNVYGMSQFADGGIFATKPYISGSSYIRRMSDYPGGEWAQKWDALYWDFIGKHHAYFLKNPRTTMIATLYTNRMKKNAKR